ncbi:hypothetical protein NQ318_015755 [Aromia moschata]|uniref:Mediator of RNA polymerase II transcription subunit 19 n=1 Tax=Aromia moschata TaxID=1265417 RepID=A0AAV8XMV4_9CUCU|nr:hypothetical protein NQ318_015755 [Aromia moschata]
MSSPIASPSVKKHKKHKGDKRDREDKPGGLKLILKVGSQTTPEHNTEFAQNLPVGEGTEEPMQLDPNDPYLGCPDPTIKKSKKKKKKKDKNKDREKKHKHHHKDKKRKEGR